MISPPPPQKKKLFSTAVFRGAPQVTNVWKRLTPMTRVANMCSITRIVMDFAFTNDGPFLMRVLGLIFRLGLRKQKIKEPPFYLTPKICRERRTNCSFTRLVYSDCGKI